MRKTAICVVLCTTTCGGGTEPSAGAASPLAGQWQVRAVIPWQMPASPCMINPIRPAATGCITDTMAITVIEGPLILAQAGTQGVVTYYTVSANLSGVQYAKGTTNTEGCSSQSLSCWQSTYPPTVFTVMPLAEMFAQPMAGGFVLTAHLHEGNVGSPAPHRILRVLSAPPGATRLYDSTAAGVVELRRP